MLGAEISTETKSLRNFLATSASTEDTVTTLDTLTPLESEFRRALWAAGTGSGVEGRLGISSDVLASGVFEGYSGYALESC